jgi:1,2-dihydroxy-3-keto-5-methylthiopentene dioxygenase
VKCPAWSVGHPRHLDGEQSDLISVSANTKQWFDLGEHPEVCAIRSFTNLAGWVPEYTNSSIEQRYR